MQAEGKLSFKEQAHRHDSHGPQLGTPPLPVRLHAVHAAIADMACTIFELRDGLVPTANTPAGNTPGAVAAASVSPAPRADLATPPADVASDLLGGPAALISAAIGTGEGESTRVARAEISDPLQQHTGVMSGGGQAARPTQDPTPPSPLYERLLLRRRGGIPRPQGTRGTTPAPTHLAVVRLVVFTSRTSAAQPRRACCGLHNPRRR